MKTLALALFLFAQDPAVVQTIEYVVDSVEIVGVQETAVSSALLKEIRGLAGQTLSVAETDRLRSALAGELGKDFNATWRTSFTGNGSGRVRLIFDAFRVPWLPFRGPDAFVSYHPKLNLSAVLPVPLWDDAPGRNSNCGGDCLRRPHSRIKHEPTRKFTLGLANSGDDLIERYKGFFTAFEVRRAGTNRVGLRLDYSVFGSRWKPQVRAATAALPDFDLYRARHTLEPSAAFALTRDVYATTGVRWVDLDLDLPSGSASRSANAGTGGVHYGHTFTSLDRDTHNVAVAYSVTTAAGSLNSDYVYTRHLWNANYTLGHALSSISLKFSGGRITGTAPLFERFSLGNTETLRGWNRFDLAPRGGDRMVHGSLEWGYTLFHAFYDGGTVWDSGNPIHMRSSIGVGVGTKKHGGITLAFRVQGARLKPTILLTLK